MRKNNRIDWIDGIRGIACILIFLHHFCLMFYPAIHFGAATPSMFYNIDTALSQSPLSVVINGNFLVAIFLTISGAVISMQVMTLEDKKGVADLIVKRYLRLIIPLVPVGLLVYAMLQLDLFANMSVAEITHSVWASSYYNTKYTLPSVLKMIFADILFVGNYDLSNAFWMLAQLFYGTFTSIILSVISWKYKKHAWLIYLLVSCALFNYGNLQIAFVFGTLLAWMHINQPGWFNKYAGIALLVVGLVLGGYPSGVVPTNFYRYFSAVSEFDIHALGAICVLYGVWSIKEIQSLLSTKVFSFLGKISYAVYLIHIPLLFSLSASLFLYARAYFSYSYCVLFSLSISLVVLILAAYLYHRYVEQKSLSLQNKILSWFLD